MDAVPAESSTDLHGRLADLRNRLLRNPRFQEIVASLPGIRWIARRKARRAFDLCSGFVQSQILAAAIELDLLHRLVDGPLDVDELRSRIALPDSGARRLISAALGVALIERRQNNRIALAETGAALLGNPGALAMVRHNVLLYRDLSDPVALLRGDVPETALRGFWDYAGATAPGRPGTSEVGNYTDLMARSQSLVASEIIDSFDFGRYRRLLDVGGGNGSFLIRVAEAAPDLQLTLFDLPAVAEQAGRTLSAAGLSGRSSVASGDARHGPLPAGADLISLVRVLHDHDDEDALAILGSVRRAIAPAGTLLIAEPMAEVPGAEAVGAYFEMYLLAMGSGRPRTAAELTAMLQAAGFEQVVRLPTRQPLLTSLLTARPTLSKKGDCR